jgi:hypothetical protein
MRAMPLTRRFTYLALSFSLLLIPASAQKMTPREYHNYLAHLDTTVERLRKEVAAIDPEKLEASYTLGKNIDKYKEMLALSFKLVQGFTTASKSIDVLSTDIAIENSLSDELGLLGQLECVLFDSPRGVVTAAALNDREVEITELQIGLRKHITAFADELQQAAFKPEH